MNSNQKISHIITETLFSLGCRDACISPGARNAPIALSLSDRFECYNLLDERSCAFTALGIAKYKKIPTVVNCTSGTAVANLFPAIIEARMSETPLIVITADRPKKMIDRGENQTIYQENIFNKYVLKYVSIDSSLEKIEETIFSAYKAAMGQSNNQPLPEKGPVHINVHLDEPTISYKTNTYYVNNDFKPINIHNEQNNIKINNSNKPIIVCGQSNLSQDKKQIFKLSEKYNIPILSDISSNITTHPNIVCHYDLYIDKIKFDTVFRFGRKTLSKKLNALISKCENTFLIRDERRFNDDANKLVSFIKISDFMEYNYCNSKTDWIDSIKKCEAKYKSKIDNLMTKNKSLNEYSLAYTFKNQIKSDSNIFIGNSIIIRAFNLLFNTFQENINIFSNRGASGIDGNIATAIGITISSKIKNNYLILGDQSFMHDIGSLKILKDLNISLTIIVINNSGGGIFDYLPISNNENKINYKKFIRNDHNETFQRITESYGINYTRIEKLSDFNLPKTKESKVIELLINKDSALNFYKNLIS